MNNKIYHWQQHVGSVWASLLCNHSLNCSGTIIEIGPGFTDKIGCGLAKLQFRGKLYVVEPNELALQWVVHRYQTLLPTATIIAVNKPMQDACAILPRAVEAILMNHVLDDMLLYAGLAPAEQQSIFSQTRPGEPCLSQVKNTWQGLLSNPQYLSELKYIVLNDICSLVDHADARIIGMSQYKSWFLAENELKEADLKGNELLREMVSQLGDMSIEDKDILCSYGQDWRNWLVIEKESVYEIPDTQSKTIQHVQEIKV